MNKYLISLALFLLSSLTNAADIYTRCDGCTNHQKTVEALGIASNSAQDTPTVHVIDAVDSSTKSFLVILDFGGIDPQGGVSLNAQPVSTPSTVLQSVTSAFNTISKIKTIKSVSSQDIGVHYPNVGYLINSERNRREVAQRLSSYIGAQAHGQSNGAIEHIIESAMKDLLQTAVTVNFPYGSSHQFKFKEFRVITDANGFIIGSEVVYLPVTGTGKDAEENPLPETLDEFSTTFAYFSESGTLAAWQRAAKNFGSVSISTSPGGGSGNQSLGHMECASSGNEIRCTYYPD
ncbi:hypothetical protein L1F30_01350 [Simiduia sp. 21SJ11W-1]|uniref:hypothetical protein n=1 Tax=Simiduia sp. 21SJ11W-1 TaxID=2909669 RepID=UPI0020A1DDDC|nr:hypothetical protein [Simiduia sp. 21SJ11W-1]UTA48200.1 hypothetical protein L1F30_01350 [Simiduia sp. 21SJ11W-1]